MERIDFDCKYRQIARETKRLKVFLGFLRVLDSVTFRVFTNFIFKYAENYTNKITDKWQRILK